MSFRRLYELVQQQPGRISTRWLKEEAIRLSDIAGVKEQWSGVIDPAVIRGFYIEGPMGPPVPLGDSESLIVLARAMCQGPLGDHWRRFIYTKELMHVFDTAEEKAGDEETFDRQIDKFGDPSAPMNPQFKAEVKALWRALAVLCTDVQRLEYKRAVLEGQISLDVVASALRLPTLYVQQLFRDDFENYVNSVLD